MIFQNKQKQLQTKLKDYYQQVHVSLDEFRIALKSICQNPDRARLEESSQKVSKAESLADDTRREIEDIMYSKALFPESRGDILGLIESMDKVPNHAESSVRMVLVQHISIPDFLCEGIIRLTDVTCRCVDAMLDSAEKLFSEYTGATVSIGRIDELESEADRLESELIDRIFSSKIDGLDKILLRDLVEHLAEISDRAENVGDRIRIICSKRSL